MFLCSRLVRFTTIVVALFGTPCSGQFGVAGNKRQAGTNFEDLQEMAKKRAQGGGNADDAMANMQEMMKNAMNDPEYLKALGDFGDEFGSAMEQMLQMSPEQLKEQMAQAMKLMTDGDIVENVVNQREDVLKTLESTGVISDEELEKFKSDPNYFEQRMRESFAQMGELFSNEEYITKAAEAMKGMSDMLSNPNAMDDMMNMLSSQWQDDDKIEEARLQFISGDFGGIPGFQDAFETDEMQEILKDPVKWRETVKEGFNNILGGGGLAGDDGSSTGKDEL